MLHAGNYHAWSLGRLVEGIMHEAVQAKGHD